MAKEYLVKELTGKLYNIVEYDIIKNEFTYYGFDNEQEADEFMMFECAEPKVHLVYSFIDAYTVIRED